MSAKILTSTLIGLDAFRQDPLTALQQAEKGTLAVLDNYAPVMYAITPKRLAELLALEAAARQPNDVALDDSLYDDSPPRSIRRQVSSPCIRAGSRMPTLRARPRSGVCRWVNR